MSLLSGNKTPIVARGSLRVNSLLLLLARITAQLLAVLFAGFLARRLGVQDFGRFAFIASLIFVGNTFTNFGTDTFLVRETARNGKVTDAASRALSLQFAFSALYCAAMLALRDTPLFFYSLALFPLAVFSVNNALLRGLSRFDLFWLLSLANGLLQVIAALLSRDILSLCLSLLLGQILISVLSLRICSASLPYFRLLPLNDFFPIFKLILPFAVLTILLVVIQRLGILFTSSMLDDGDTGYFSAVTRVIEGLKLGHYAILGALLPALSQGVTGSRKSFRRAFFLLMVVSLIFALSLTILSAPVLRILYGDAFIPASNDLALLGWSLIPYTVSSFISYDLIARGMESIIVRAALLSLFIYIALYLVLIPKLGLDGAIRSSLYGEWLQGFVFIMFYFYALRPAKDLPPDESR